ncbi:universal stress protein [Brevibacterium jeotgali]|uniref:Universal stress protein family protein n=1 Tax=Brevibacterium jeotgali TaxID=1262550 RepID=A0A2H1L742_9MICO|nr:universal stress protein [Brevibacterium jeotgali]TWC02230.1 universal stress protein family protein [Brevibacterium jeotgali]SMY12718.1 Universal stress protein family protein [Brevibacterium jeotgali]
MTILVGYTPTPAGRAAVDFAIEEAQIRKTGLLVVNAGVGEQREEAGVAAREQMDQVRFTLENSAVDFELVQHLRGHDAAEELLDLEDENPEITMIVIGSRKRSAVGKLIMGSTGQRIILGSSVPVVAVKAH